MLKAAEWTAITAAVVLLLSLAVVSYLSSPPPANPSEQQSAAQTETEHQGKEQHSVAGFVRFMFPDAISIFTFWLVLATVILAIIAVVQLDFLGRAEGISKTAADAAKKSAEVAEGTLIATNRPWIQVKSVSIEGPLGFGREYGDDVGGGIDLKIHAKNIGNSPAVRVGVAVRLSANFDHLASQREFCEAVRKSRDPVLYPNVLRPENSLFPNDEAILTVRAWTSAEDIKIARQRAANMPDNKVNIAVVGCVYYELPFVAGWHQTGIILDLKKRTLYPENTPPASYSAVPIDQYTPNLRTYNPDRISDGVRLEGAIPADDLTLTRNMVGAGPTD